MRGVLLASVLVLFVAGQDGTQGSLVREPSVFLIPPQSAMNAWTGARKKLMSPEFGRDFAYNCSNGVMDWVKTLGYFGCEKPMQSPISITPDMMPSQPRKHVVRGFGAVQKLREVKSASGVMKVDFADTLWTASNIYSLNLTLAPAPVPSNRSRQLGLDGPRDNAILLSLDDSESETPSQRFVLRQVEFHTPAEHLVNGIRFSLEIQLHLESSTGERLSVASFGRVTEAQYVSPDLLDLASTQLPTIPDAGVTDISINPAAFLPRLEGFWKYSGGQTTPPCLGDVTWIISHYPVNVTKDLLDKVTSKIHSRYVGGNARDVQTRDLGYVVDLYIGSSDILFESPFSLTNAQYNVTLRKGSVDWGRESTVVDIAHQWALRHTALPVDLGMGMGMAAMDESAEEGWGWLLDGRPLSLEDSGRRNWYAFIDSVATLESSIYRHPYQLIQNCDREYAWKNRFINPNINGSSIADTSDILEPPPVAPGAHLLQFARRASEAQIKVTPILQGIREQTVKPTDEVIHVIPESYFSTGNPESK